MSFTSPITANDGTADHDYKHVSREGMNSVYVEDGSESSLASCLNVKHTLDRTSTAKNRHLLQLSWNYIDSETGAVSSNQVYLVINRAKKEADATILNKVKQLLNVCTDARVSALLVGDN